MITNSKRNEYEAFQLTEVRVRIEIIIWTGRLRNMSCGHDGQWSIRDHRPFHSHAFTVLFTVSMHYGMAWLPGYRCRRVGAFEILHFPSTHAQGSYASMQRTPLLLHARWWPQTRELDLASLFVVVAAPATVLNPKRKGHITVIAYSNLNQSWTQIST